MIYSKTAIQDVKKKGAAQSGSPTQDGQGEKVTFSQCHPQLIDLVIYSWCDVCRHPWPHNTLPCVLINTVYGFNLITHVQYSVWLQ